MSLMPFIRIIHPYFSSKAWKKDPSLGRYTSDHGPYLVIPLLWQCDGRHRSHLHCWEVAGGIAKINNLTKNSEKKETTQLYYQLSQQYTIPRTLWHVQCVVWNKSPTTTQSHNSGAVSLLVHCQHSHGTV